MCSPSPEIETYEWTSQDLLDFGTPNSYKKDLEFQTYYVLIPHAKDTPHLPIIMVDESMGEEGKILRSELEAAVHMSRVQHFSGRFTDHKVKPVSPPLSRYLLRSSCSYLLSSLTLLPLSSGASL